MKSSFELIIVNDCSTDETLERIVAFSSGDFYDSSLVRLQVYSNDYPQFETYCDYFGFSKAEGKFLLEIQADMFINDPGFDLRMMQVFNKYDDIFALSGRGTHDISQVVDVYRESLGTDRAYASNLIFFMFSMIRRRIIGKLLRILKVFKCIKAPRIQITPVMKAKLSDSLMEIFPTLKDFEEQKKAGLLGDLIENQGFSNEPIPRKVFLGETVMRGPIMMRSDIYFLIGGLDVNSFFQGFDDHELMLRAWSLTGKRCAYIPVNMNSILSQGTTRKPRSVRSDIEIFVRTFKISRNRKSSLLHKLSQGDQFTLPNFEIRKF
jgi:glycosyltransferase involved in cell wall biosynthesis